MRPPQPLIFEKSVARRISKGGLMEICVSYLSSTTLAKERPSLARWELTGCSSSTARIASLISDTSFAVMTAAASGATPPGRGLGMQTTKGKLSFRGSVPASAGFSDTCVSKRRASSACDEVAEAWSAHANAAAVLCCVPEEVSVWQSGYVGRAKT